MEFRVLGPLEVADQGGLVPLGGRRQRLVLAVLFVNAGEVVSTDRLIDEVWGERPPPAVPRVMADETSELVLIVDQFEELFVLVDDAAAGTSSKHSRIRTGDFEWW